MLRVLSGMCLVCGSDKYRFVVVPFFLSHFVVLCVCGCVYHVVHRGAS